MKALLLAPALMSMLACAPKTGRVQSEQTLDVALVATLEPLDDPQVLPIPAELQEGLAALLQARNLHAVPMDEAQWMDAFSRGRTSRFRVEHVTSGTSAPLVLVVETFARYGSQLNGRYRWTVQVVASLAPGDAPQEAVQSEFSVPVFLEYHHQKEAEAVLSAAPVIERQVGHLVDQVLGGMAGP